MTIVGTRHICGRSVRTFPTIYWEKCAYQIRKGEYIQDVAVAVPNGIRAKHQDGCVERQTRERREVRENG